MSGGIEKAAIGSAGPVNVPYGTIVKVALAGQYVGVFLVRTGSRDGSSRGGASVRTDKASGYG